jgi:hypothetical protein
MMGICHLIETQMEVDDLERMQVALEGESC